MQSGVDRQGAQDREKADAMLAAQLADNGDDELPVDATDEPTAALLLPEADKPGETVSCAAWGHQDIQGGRMLVASLAEQTCTGRSARHAALHEKLQ